MTLLGNEKTELKTPKKKGINPFLGGLSFKMMNKETRFLSTQSYTEGVTTIKREIIEYDVLELDPFVKVYRFPRQVGFINQLNGAGSKLFLYVQCKLEHEKDTIILKTEKVAKELNVSVATVYNCIDNLIDAGVLCKKGNSEYWINPSVLYNGNRKEYILQNAPERVEYVKDPKPTIQYDQPVPEGNTLLFNKIQK